MPLADRIVLITGASGGVGTVVTQRFAEAGARLGLVGRDRERLVAAAAAAGSKDLDAAALLLTTRDQVKQTVAGVAGYGGSLDVIIDDAE